MTNVLNIIDETMSTLSTAEAALERAAERLNPVAQRSARALLVNELSSLRDDIREFERKRSRLTANACVLEPDARALAELAGAIDRLRELAGKGEKTERLVPAIGSAVSAAKSVLSAV